MKQAVITGERQAALIDVPDPRPVADWALVKVTVAPMCTEYKQWLSGSPGQFLGHEAVGEVVDVAQRGPVAVGDRVIVMPQYPCGVCPLCVAGEYIHCEHAPSFEQFTGSPYGRATMAQYLLKPGWILPRIPDDLTDEQAGLALCALGPSFGAFSTMQVTAFDTVLITGLGPVGLGAVVNACYRGARVLAVESNAWRANLARELGATEVLDPADPDILKRIRDLTGGVGVDQALDCAGALPAQRLLIDATRRKGQVAFVAEASHETPIRVSPDLVRKGLKLIGQWHYNLNGVPGILQVIRRSPVAGRLITHMFGMSRIQEAFATLAGQETGKVLLRPWE